MLFSRELRFRDQGPDVKFLQQFLLAIGMGSEIPDLVANGKFDGPTENAMEKVQVNFRIPVTRVFDAETRAAVANFHGFCFDNIPD